MRYNYLFIYLFIFSTCTYIVISFLMMGLGVQVAGGFDIDPQLIEMVSTQSSGWGERGEYENIWYVSLDLIHVLCSLIWTVPEYEDGSGGSLQCKSRKENPQKPTQLSSRSHPRHLVGKRTAQKTPS